VVETNEYSLTTSSDTFANTNAFTSIAGGDKGSILEAWAKGISGDERLDRCGRQSGQSRQNSERWRRSVPN
jgi:hypothetical protein